MNRRKRLPWTMLLFLLTFLVPFTLAGTGSAAEKYPSREIILVNYKAAGGSLDLECRVFAEFLKKEMGVPVVVEIRTEGGGIKGIVDVYRAKPDGYTLLPNLMPTNALAEIGLKAPFKILEMTYLEAFRKQEILVAVNKDSPYQTAKDLLEASKRKSLNCGVSGMAGTGHLAAMLLKKKVGVRLEVVPFKGTGPAMIALLGGNVDVATPDVASAVIQREKLRILGVFSDQRSKTFPSVPTFKEMGYDVQSVDTYLGICGPPKLPQDIQKILSAAIGRVMKNPEFIKKVEEMGTTPIFMPGPEFQRVSELSYKLVEEYKEIFVETK